MLAEVKQPFDAATHDLWRVAECGDASELAAIVSRGVDVNARNEYGSTALMRAASEGHASVVRSLLEHGANPNITRNDKFTALALAAFFGHTETVRILIEHGAKTEIVTRSGTSPRMWATARTFSDVARCIENPVRAPVAPVAPRSAVAVAPAPVVKTLKDPPEIWELVHEAPKEFDARWAFVARFTSMKRPFAAGAFAGLLFAVACGMAGFVFRNSQARNVTAEVPTVRTAAEVQVAPPAPVESPVTEAPATIVDNPLSAHVVRKSPVIRQTKPRPAFTDNVVEVAPIREAPPVALPEVEKPKPRESPVKLAPNASLSPHLITPAKSAASKSKVIQWP